MAAARKSAHVYAPAPGSGRWELLLAALALLQAVALAVVSFMLADRHFMLPLDDSYIHLQYARMMAAGQPLVYTTGMTSSGGMTSPLYVMLLTPALWIGLGGVKGAAAAFALGTVVWMAIPIVVGRLAGLLAGPLAGRIAGLLVLANGHLLWNALSGMETGVYTLLILGAVWGIACWLREELPAGRTLAIGCLAMLPLIRPEGLYLTGAAILLAVLRRGDGPRLGIIPLLLTILPFLGWLAILRIGTGDWRPAGLTIKGLSAQPYFNLSEKAAYATETLSRVAMKFHANVIPDPLYAGFKGDPNLPYMPAGLGLLAALGAGFLLVGEWRSRRPAAGVYTVAAWVLGLGTVAASMLPFIHQQRYLAPYTALAIVLAMVALARLAQLFKQHEETSLRAAGIGLLLVSLPSVPFWMVEYGRNARDIFHLLRVASFSTASSNEPIAITDAGVLAYYGNGPRYDLVGLCSREFTRATAHGEGATLEALSRLPESRRPATLLSYPNWWSAAFPLGPPLQSWSIPRTTITSGILLQQWPIDWQAIDRGAQPPAAVYAGERLALEVDVADLESERTAGYRFAHGPYDFDPRAWPQPLAPVASFEVQSVTVADPATTGTLTIGTTGRAVDGGRTIRGESFVYTPGQFPTRPHTLYLRVSRPPLGSFGAVATELRVLVRSDTTGYTVARPVAGMVPGDAKTLSANLADVFDEVGGTSWRISIEGVPAGAAWSSYHIWMTSER